MDHYTTLGVSKTASPDEIKQAYRRMAAKHHPDKSGGDTATFQKIEEAYRTLSDTEKRQQYDNPGQQFGGFPFNFGGNPFEDIFSQFTKQHQQTRQQIYTVTVFVTLEQVASGAAETIRVQTPQGVKTFNINIPHGIEDGQNVRYDGLMSDGILQIAFRIHSHPEFVRRGLDIYSTAKISVFDMILGATIRVKTIYGDELDVTVPPRTNPGSTLRIADRGMTTPSNKGHQFVLLSPVIPDTISDELLALLEVERNKTNSQ